MGSLLIKWITAFALLSKSTLKINTFEKLLRIASIPAIESGSKIFAFQRK
jgi:hypothetical protein